MYAAGDINGSLIRDTQSIEDVFVFVLTYYHTRHKSRVVNTTKSALDNWRCSLMLWFTKLAYKVTPSMYLNNPNAATQPAPARRSFSGRDCSKRKDVRMDIAAKWRLLCNSRQLGLSLGALLDARKSPDDEEVVDVTSAYGSGATAAKHWVAKLNKMYVESANCKLAGA